MNDLIVIAAAASASLTLSSGAAGSLTLSDPDGGLMVIPALQSTLTPAAQPAAELLISLAGLKGDPGADSTVPGPPGEGVPVGGTTGQVLTKASNADHDTDWQTPAGGGGVTDGDKSDIVVSGGGTVWMLDAAVVASFAPAVHTHILTGITDVTITVANLNALDDGANTALHFHDADRDRANHTGSQLLATISDVSITVANLNALDDGANTALHFHDADRARANHAGTQTAATISDFAAAADARVSAGIATHEAAGDPHPQYLTPAEGVAAFEALGTMASHLAAGDPHPQYLTPAEGNAAYSVLGHTHLLANVTDVTMTVANLNTLDDGANTALHFHDADRARANHAGTQTAATISDFAAAADARVSAGIATHEAAGDPHPQYLTPAEGNAAYQPLDSDLTTIAGLTATTDSFMQAKGSAWAARTIAEVKTDLGLTGTNSGDQTSIAGITGTKAQFNTANTDGDFVYVSAPITLPAGTASVAPLTFTSGTLKTTPAAGDVEMDANCFYMTTDAGNRGVNLVEHFIRQGAEYTLTSSVAEQKLFNASANGRLTLETGTYFFECMFALRAMSATSGNCAFDILGAGSATLADVLYQVAGIDGVVATVAAQSGAMNIIGQTAASLVTAGIAAEAFAFITGSFEVTGAGTIVPSVTLVTAAAAIVRAGSYFRCRRIGAANVALVGQWD